MTTPSIRTPVIGTNKCLYIYFEGAFYDITPLDSTRQQTGATFTTTSGSSTVTLTTSTAHDAEAGDIILGSSATSVPGGFSASDFDDILFEVAAVPSATTIEVTMGSNAGSTAGPSGTVTLDFYYVIGPLIQTYGYGCIRPDIDGGPSYNSS